MQVNDAVKVVGDEGNRIRLRPMRRIAGTGERELQTVHADRGNLGVGVKSGHP
jgi:hypothetical protein